MIEPSTTAPVPERQGLGWPEIEWSIPAFLIAFGAGIMGSIVGLVVVASASPVDFTSPSPLDAIQTSVVLLFQVASNIAAVFIMSLMRETPNPTQAVGLTLRVRDAWGILAGLVLQIVVAVSLTFMLDRFVDGEIPEAEAARLLAEVSGLGAQILSVLALVVLGPIAEEIMFRGMLLPRLSRSMGKHAAVVVSSAIFASVHLVDPNTIYGLPGLFVIGIVLGYMAVASGNLSLPIFGHIGVNLTAAVLIFAGEDMLETSSIVRFLFAG